MESTPAVTVVGNRQEECVVDIAAPLTKKDDNNTEVVRDQDTGDKEADLQLGVTNESTLSNKDEKQPNYNESILKSCTSGKLSWIGSVELPTGDSVASTSKTSDTESICSVEKTPSLSLASSETSEKYYENAVASSSKHFDPGNPTMTSKKLELYGSDVGPKWYNVKGNLVTPPIIATNLPKMFNYLPIFGKLKAKEDKDSFYANRIREFVGFDLNDQQFDSLANFCSPENLKTGEELVMSTQYPTLSVLSVFDQKEYDQNDSNLCIVKKHHLRIANDPSNNYQKRMKYRGIRLMPLTQVEPEDDNDSSQDLEPGKDLLYHVRIYRPFPYNIKERHVRETVSSRHSVFSRDLVMLGRARLSALRDRVVCANDAGLRLDTAACPHAQPETSAKELFPSGFLFINNVFYVDARGRCADRSAPLREWARARGLGAFPARDLHATRLDEICLRLGHPEVYVHQGNCEHLFTFSEIRLLSTNDPLSSSQYPCHTAVSQNQSVYCTTCAEFGAKWVVTGCATVPFDPAYFCDTCLKKYLYIDGKPIGDFKCYAYRGNEINMLKTHGLDN